MEKLSSVILVEDDPSTNFINEALLRSLGVTDTVATARNGAEALALLEEPGFTPSLAHPALVLLDMAMPVMNGVEFLTAYQHLPDAVRTAVRVVVLSVGMNSEELARIDELPIAGLVSKPLTAEKLDMVLQLHFQRSLPLN